MVDINKRGNTKIGIAIYARDEWKILQENSSDGLESESYEEWTEATEKVKNRLRGEGHDPIDVPINVREMQSYFDERGLENNGKNRSQYVALKLREMDEKG